MAISELEGFDAVEFDYQVRGQRHLKPSTSVLLSLRSMFPGHGLFSCHLDVVLLSPDMGSISLHAKDPFPLSLLDGVNATVSGSDLVAGGVLPPDVALAAFLDAVKTAITITVDIAEDGSALATVQLKDFSTTCFFSSEVMAPLLAE